MKINIFKNKKNRKFHQKSDFTISILNLLSRIMHPHDREVIILDKGFTVKCDIEPIPSNDPLEIATIMLDELGFSLLQIIPNLDENIKSFYVLGVKRANPMLGAATWEFFPNQHGNPCHVLFIGHYNFTFKNAKLDIIARSHNQNIWDMDDTDLK